MVDLSTASPSPRIRQQASRRPPGVRAGSQIERRRARWGWLYVAPFGVFLIAFLIIPLIYAFILSLQTRTLAAGDQWVGLRNYFQAFTDPEFLTGVGRVALFGLVMVPIQMIVALIAAFVIDAVITRFTRFSRIFIFVPYAVPAVIGALMWGFLYSPDFGPAQEIFGLVGLKAPNFFASGAVFWSLVNIVTWEWSGYYMIIIYAALQAIDPAIYEAARVDGAGPVTIALRVKFPLIRSAMVLIVVFALIGTLQLFNEPEMLQGMAAGSITASYTPNIYAYTTAFSYHEFGYASAIAFALGLFVFIGSYIFMFATRKQSGMLK